MELHELKEYIKHVGPNKKQKCEAWKVAIGLQAVDGLAPSSFLLDTARREIEGEITIAEAELLIKSYYKTMKKQVAQPPQVGGKISHTTPQVKGKTPQVTPQVQGIYPPSNHKVVELIKVVGREQLSTKEIMNGLGLKDRKNFGQLYLIPALDSNFLRYLYPDKPKHPRQKYLLTVKGLMLLDEMVDETVNEIVNQLSRTNIGKLCHTIIQKID